MDQATNLRRIVKKESGKVHKLRANNSSISQNTSPMVFAVTSGKGGVGKTNIVGNLAITYQRMRKKVLIFDADLWLANIDIIFGISPKYTIEDVIKGEKELSQIIAKGPEGVAIIPASSGVQELSNLTEGHKINLLNEFDLLNSMYDILLIDTGAGISSNVLYFNLAAQERIVVVTPEPTSVTDAYALIKVMFKQHGIKNFMLLMNMVKNESEALSVYKHLSRVIEKFMGSISLDYAGYIPYDKYIHESVNKRKPVTCCYPQSNSSQCFKQLAEYLLNLSDGKHHDGSIKFFWKKLMIGATG
ncbi:MAG: MinD/ParA family protein [Desulfobacterales bacterium]